MEAILTTAATIKEGGLRPEIALLLCCARAPQDEEAVSQAEALLPQVEDWDYLLELALRHKIMPLVYRRINSFFSEMVPSRFMERLRDYFYLTAARNHFLTEELCRILRLFESEGIRCVPYKGPALATILYGDAAFRQFSDLDIFIHRDDLNRAAALLRLRGYMKEHELTSRQEAAFMKVECQRMFRRDEGRVFLELHWGFAPTYFPLRLDAKNMWTRLHPLLIGTARSHTFSPEDLVLILCVNAGKDFWKELGPVCDVAELVRANPELDWEKVQREAMRAGARRMLYVTLLLARDLLWAIIPEKMAREIEADRGAENLAAVVGQKLFSGARERESLVSQYLMPAKALDGRRDRVRFHLRLALTPTHEDWAFINWPHRLRFLYYLTRPLRLARKYLLRQRKSKISTEETPSAGH